ncbi:hypothetical protein SETIT_1G007500v2 [Setaria italica]|uniref:DNA-directed RNA polymerase insert domain-containing protein n=1 Tax=Setaria italica TaxID=4555 RepID=A0A368PHJ2_SETIT|nr:hypothetical protein SETIT_1G007500v2 [Setaria italica]
MKSSLSQIFHISSCPNRRKRRQFELSGKSMQEILLNLKEIVLRSNLYGVRDASICVKGPRYITAQDIILPPSIEIVDTIQPIANLREPIDFYIELQIKRDRGYHTELRKNSQDGSYPIDVVSMPIRNVNYSIFYIDISYKSRC